MIFTTKPLLEKVILFSQPGALPASGLEAVIKKVREIDMAEVNRVCPATRRGKSN